MKIIIKKRKQLEIKFDADENFMIQDDEEGIGWTRILVIKICNEIILTFRRDKQKFS